MYAEAVIRVLIHALIVFGGAVFIGGAITNFKKEQYAAFGMNFMLSMLMIKMLWMH